MKNEPVSIKTLIMPLNKPRYRNTLRHDSKAVRIVGDLAADVSSAPDLLRSNKGLAIFGSLLSMATNPNFENRSLPTVNAVLAKNWSRLGIALSPKMRNSVTAHLLR